MPDQPPKTFAEQVAELLKSDIVQSGKEFNPHGSAQDRMKYVIVRLARASDLIKNKITEILEWIITWEQFLTMLRDKDIPEMQKEIDKLKERLEKLEGEDAICETCRDRGCICKFKRKGDGLYRTDNPVCLHHHPNLEEK